MTKHALSYLVLSTVRYNQIANIQVYALLHDTFCTAGVLVVHILKRAVQKQMESLYKYGQFAKRAVAETDRTIHNCLLCLDVIDNMQHKLVYSITTD